MAVTDLHIVTDPVSDAETSGPTLAPAVGDEHRTGGLEFRPDLAGWLAARSAQRDRMRRSDLTLVADTPAPLAPVVPLPVTWAGVRDVTVEDVTADGVTGDVPVLTLVPARPRYGLRRALVLAIAIAVGAIGWSVAGWLDGSPVVVDSVGADLTDAARPTVTVQPGDTLWSIAASLDPDGDIRALVDRLAELNGGASLTVGQRLVLPG